jgi:hypothetical protein
MRVPTNKSGIPLPPMAVAEQVIHDMTGERLQHHEAAKIASHVVKKLFEEGWVSPVRLAWGGWVRSSHPRYVKDERGRHQIDRDSSYETAEVMIIEG